MKNANKSDGFICTTGQVFNGFIVYFENKVINEINVILGTVRYRI